jgi:hypothetical protein
MTTFLVELTITYMKPHTAPGADGVGCLQFYKQINLPFVPFVGLSVGDGIDCLEVTDVMWELEAGKFLVDVNSDEAADHSDNEFVHLIESGWAIAACENWYTEEVLNRLLKNEALT